MADLSIGSDATGFERFGACADNVGRGIEVRLADLEVHDIHALGFQPPGFRQNFESGFGTETAHSFR